MSDSARERAENVLSLLATGQTNPWANSGYGYENMGDMARDLEPLARDLLAALERVDALETDIRRMTEVYGDRAKREEQLEEALERQMGRVDALTEALGPWWPPEKHGLVLPPKIRAALEPLAAVEAKPGVDISGGQG